MLSHKLTNLKKIMSKKVIIYDIITHRGNLYLMSKFNILKKIYKSAPMNFYVLSEDTTIIKSINNTFLGYKYDRKFSDEEISLVWKNIKAHKRFSTISIFLLFIILLYGVIFPNYSFLVDKMWYYTVIPFLLIVFVLYFIITFINTKWFEKRLKSKFGEFSKTTFTPSDIIDEKYYKLFKIELVKAFSLILIIVMCFCIGSPFKIALKWTQHKKYNDVIKLTTIGSKLFPIAPEWYSLRAYSRYQIKDYKGAINDYDRAYRLGPNEYNVMNFDNKIFVKYITKDYKSALKDFDYEISNASDEYERDAFLWDKAQFLYNIKQYESALKIYDELLVKAEEDRIFLLQNRLYFERAQVYKSLGLDEMAQQDLINAEALQIDDAFKNPIPEPVLLLDEM